jgi:hypothetical protein
MSGIFHKFSHLQSALFSWKSKYLPSRHHAPESVTTNLRYAPPPGPPPFNPRLVEFPFLSSEQVLTLYSQGYSRVHLPPDHPVVAAAATLFSASHDFFAEPLEHKKQFHLSKLQGGNGQCSEEGWFHVEGEKEMLTVHRSGQLCPPEVTDEARNLWQECGTFMQQMMRSVEESLNLEIGSFDDIVKEECALPVEDLHETLLRMFRYERTEEPRLVAEQHRDIGLLSLVIGSSPGLEVWDARARRWVAIEEDGDDTGNTGGLTFTFLIGQMLTSLTNMRYKSGVHRVFVPAANASSSTDDARYRYSLVFALRPYKEAIINTSKLTSDITGDFWEPLENVKAQTLFKAITNAHWSVNGGVAEREAQRLKLQKLRETMKQNM